MARRKTPGSPPGTISFTGEKEVENILIHHFEYNQNQCSFSEHLDASKLDLESKKSITWIDIRGLHDTELLQKIGDLFNIHPLALEDIADVHQRPKFNEYPTGNFAVFKSMYWKERRKKPVVEQISIYFGDLYLISFQEKKEDVFEEVKRRIQENSGRIRKFKAHYLAYALLDLTIDNYYDTVDELDAKILALEKSIDAGPDAEIKNRLHAIKRKTLFVYKICNPMRDALLKMMRIENNPFDEAGKVFLRDSYDHINQIIDRLETQRDLLNGLRDLYLSEISFKMNQVIQTLTIVSTIFIPLTFLAGVYGMNFHNMPELGWKYSYFGLLTIMTALAISLAFYFKKKKWF